MFGDNGFNDRNIYDLAPARCMAWLIGMELPTLGALPLWPMFYYRVRIWRHKERSALMPRLAPGFLPAFFSEALVPELEQDV